MGRFQRSAPDFPDSILRAPPAIERVVTRRVFLCIKSGGRHLESLVPVRRTRLDGAADGFQRQRDQRIRLRSVGECAGQLHQHGSQPVPVPGSHGHLLRRRLPPQGAPDHRFPPLRAGSLLSAHHRPMAQSRSSGKYGRMAESWRGVGATSPDWLAVMWNLYAYVGNDPVNRRDPSGMACVTCHCGAYYDRHVKIAYEQDIDVDCMGLATTCCREACPYRRVDGWDSCGTRSCVPLPPITCSRSMCIARCDSARDQALSACGFLCRAMGPLQWECFLNCYLLVGTGYTSCRAACLACTDP